MNARGTCSTLKRPARWIRSLVVGALAAMPLMLVGPAAAQSRPVLADEPVAELQVEPINRLGEQVPGDIRFLDHTGAEVTIGDYLGQGRPIILTLNYFRCPMLCIETLNGLIDGLMRVDWQAGRDFTLLTVSFNPEEGQELAAAKRESYLTRYTKPGVGEGWHFLTGEKDQIDRLCEAVGFPYIYVEETGEYSHPASVIFMDPEGVITLHMNDVLFQPGDLRLAIVEASQGNVGTWMDTILLFTCFQFDPDAGSYTVSILKLMRTVGVAFVAGLTIAIVLLSRRGSGSAGGRDPGAVPAISEKVATS
jgi:protein SCO1/2